MDLNDLFNLPKLMTMYEMQDNAIMNNISPLKKDNNNDKLEMMLK